MHDGLRVIYHTGRPNAEDNNLPCNEPIRMTPRFSRPVEIIIIVLILLLGTFFLLRLAYLPIQVSTPVGMIYVMAVTWFFRQQYGLKIPLILPALAVLAVAVDGIGNYFGWYRQHFRWIQYDEISHAVIPFLTAPTIIWLLREGIEKYGWRLPLSLVSFFAATTMFTISGFYEVVELWDDKYMHPEPGMRIHGPYDTPNDLQWDLIGIAAGAALTYVILKLREGAASESVVTAPDAKSR